MNTLLLLYIIVTKGIQIEGLGGFAISNGVLTSVLSLLLIVGELKRVDRRHIGWLVIRWVTSDLNGRIDALHHHLGVVSRGISVVGTAVDDGVIVRLFGWSHQEPIFKLLQFALIAPG